MFVTLSNSVTYAKLATQSIKICVQAAEQWPKGTPCCLPSALSLRITLNSTPTSSPLSFLVMILGLLDMTFKWRGNHLSWTRQIHHDPRKHKFKTMKISVDSPPNECIMRKEFVTPGQTVNGNFYCDVLRWLRENVRHKHPIKWCINSWALYHKNAPTHTSFLLQQLLTSTKMTVFTQPLYSPGLSTWFFPCFQIWNSRGDISRAQKRSKPNHRT